MTSIERVRVGIFAAAFALICACSTDETKSQPTNDTAGHAADGGGGGADLGTAGTPQGSAGRGGASGATAGTGAQAAAGSGAAGRPQAGTGGNGQPPAAGGGGNVPPDDGAADAFDPALFENPPNAWAPGLRWWWPGGSVDDAMIEAQVGRFADAGYGFVECQPMLTGITQAQVDADPRIRTVGQPEFFDRLRTLSRITRARGLQYDLTLGSGWPHGGRDVPEDSLEQQLLWTRVDVSGPGAVDVALPPPTQPSWTTDFNDLVGQPIVGAFDTAFTLHAVVAAPLVDARATPPVLGAPVDVTANVEDGRLHWDAPAGSHAVIAMYRNRTSHVVLGGAYPGKVDDARVVDHLGPGGARWVAEHLIGFWLDSLGDARPVSFFVESFELLGELPWGGALDAQYQKYLGREPHVDLPFLFRANGESKLDMLGTPMPAFAAMDAEAALRRREDYEAVRAQTFGSEYVQPMADAVRARGVSLRHQAFGGWGSVLDDYGRVDIPETETLYAGGSIDFMSLAPSAAHVAGRRLVTAEAFTTLNLVSGDALDEEAMWLLAGRLYTVGVNRFIHSGCPYPYKREDGGVWYPPDPNPDRLGAYTQLIQPGEPSYAFLNDFNRAQARIGYALSRGSPKVDLAWLMIAREVVDVAQPAVGTIGTFAPESEISAALRAASYTYDRISPTTLLAAKAEGNALRAGASTYRALLVSDAQVLDPDALAAIDAAAKSGVPVVWVGAPPTRAPGSIDAAARDAKVRELWSALQERVARAADAQSVPSSLRGREVRPEVEVTGALLGVVGILQRATASGRVVWLFNEGIGDRTVSVTQRIQAKSARFFDPASGRASDLALNVEDDGASVSVMLPSARGGVLLLAP